MISWHPTYTTSWRNPKIKALSSDGKLAFRYLHGNAYTTYSGIYCLSLKEMADDLDLDEHVLRPLIARIAIIHLQVGRKTPLVCYDPSTSVVWVVGQWKQAVSHSPSHIAGIGNEFLRTASLPFWYEYFRKYKGVAKALESRKRYKRADDIAYLMADLKPRPTNAWPPTWTMEIAAGKKKPLTVAEMSDLWDRLIRTENDAADKITKGYVDPKGRPMGLTRNGEKTDDKNGKERLSLPDFKNDTKPLQDALDSIPYLSAGAVPVRIEGSDPEKPWPKSLEDHIAQKGPATRQADPTIGAVRGSAVSEQNRVLSKEEKEQSSAFDQAPAAASDGTADADQTIGKIPVQIDDSIPNDEIVIITPPDRDGNSTAIVVQNVGVETETNGAEGGSGSGDPDPPKTMTNWDAKTDGDPWGKILDAGTGEVLDNPKIGSVADMRPGNDVSSRESGRVATDRSAADKSSGTVQRNGEKTESTQPEPKDAGEGDARSDAQTSAAADPEPASRILPTEPGPDADIHTLRAFQRELVNAKLEGRIGEFYFRKYVKRTANRMEELEGKT